MLGAAARFTDVRLHYVPSDTVFTCHAQARITPEARCRFQFAKRKTLKNSRHSTLMCSSVRDIADKETEELESRSATRGNQFVISAAGLEAVCDVGISVDACKPIDVAKITHELRTRKDTGLSGDPDDLEARKVAFGGSQMPEVPKKSFLTHASEALDDFTLYVLMGAGGISFVLWFILDQAEGPGWIDGAAILSAVLVVVLVAATTNYQRDIQFADLSAAEKNVFVRVRRNGQEQSIPGAELVVGDVLIIESGDVLTADGLLLEGYDIRTDESHLTGETEDAIKSVDGDLRLLSGSRVLSGFGLVVVLAVGLRSQQGKIFAMTQPGATGPSEDSAQPVDYQQASVLEEKLEGLAEQIGKFGAVAAILTFSLQLTVSLLQLSPGESVFSLEYLRVVTQFVVNAIAILVVAIPEGLPLAVTIALAFSVKRMLADNNLVRHLRACETMATCTSICSDKTGTLTLNKMKVVEGWVAGLNMKSSSPVDSMDILDTSTSDIPEDLAALESAVLHGVKRGIILNSTASLSNNGDGGIFESGNRTECALLRFACGMGADAPHIRKSSQTIAALPFSSDRKRMSMVVRYDQSDKYKLRSPGEMTLFCKGAAEVVLERCTWQMTPDGNTEPLDQRQKDALLKDLSKGALRLVALAARRVEESAVPSSIGRHAMEELEEDLTLVAILGIQDELRPEVPKSVQNCQDAGITVRMLTGDNAVTATSIAFASGILKSQESGREDLSLSGPSNGSSALLQTPSGEIVMNGEDFRNRVTLPDGSICQQEFDTLWPKLRVLARCTPKDKYTIIQGCQTYRLPDGRRDIVAMTGDGTNDAPALRLANVGFAMISGSSIARQASDIILMNDNFSSIVQSVKWGRNVYTSIVKFLQFQLTINVVAVVTAVSGVAIFQESPLTAVQMLWVNMIMDSLASVSLATEAPSLSLLNMPPVASTAPLVTPTCLKHIVGQATYQLLVMAAILGPGPEAWHMSHVEHLTFLFNTFVVIQLFNQVACRKVYDEPNIFEGILQNRTFLWVLGAETVCQVAIVTYGGSAFDTVPLSKELWLVAAGFGAFSWVIRSALLAIPTPENVER